MSIDVKFQYYKEIYDPELDSYVLYHGTHHIHLNNILTEGLKGGNNTSGGTHGVWEEPTLFMAARHFVAEKYGNTVLKIIIPAAEFQQFVDLDMYKINDGLGDRCYILEDKSEDWDRVLIPAQYITECDCEDCMYYE